MLKKHMTPLSKGGQLIKTKNKGASPFPGPLSGLTQAAPSANNYAKQTPMPMAPTPPMGQNGVDDDAPGQDGGI